MIGFLGLSEGTGGGAGGEVLFVDACVGGCLELVWGGGTGVGVAC